MIEKKIMEDLDTQALPTGDMHARLRTLIDLIEHQRLALEQRENELLQRERGLCQREAELQKREELLNEEKSRLLEEVERGERLMVQARAMLGDTDEKIRAVIQVDETQLWTGHLGATISFSDKNRGHSPKEAIYHEDANGTGKTDKWPKHIESREPSHTGRVVQICFIDQPLPPVRFRLKQELARLLPSASIGNGPDGISVTVVLNLDQHDESVVTINNVLGSLDLRAEFIDMVRQ